MSDLKKKSRIMTEGDARAPNRAMLRAVGFTDEDFNKSIIGVASAGSDVTTCNMHLNTLAEKVREGIRVAGGVSQLFHTDRKSTRLNSSHSSISYAVFFFFNDTATTEIYTLSLHDALPI